MSRPGHSLTLNEIKKNSKLNSVSQDPNSLRTHQFNVSNSGSKNFTYGINFLQPVFISPQANLGINESDTLGDINRDLKTLPNELHNEFRKISNNLEDINRHLKIIEDEESIKDDWQFAGMVIDKLCFIVFSAFFVIFSIVLFFTVPGIFENKSFK